MHEVKVWILFQVTPCSKLPRLTLEPNCLVVSRVGSAMKKWKSENLAFNCSYKQHYVSNKQLRIQISEITARCSAIASRKSKLSWPLTSGLNKTYFQQLAGSWQFAFCCTCLVPFQQFLQQLRLANLPSQVSVSGLEMSDRSTIIEIYLK